MISAMPLLERSARRKLVSVLRDELPELLRNKMETNRRREAVHAVDGRSIGTGRPDFTKGNISYSLFRDGLEFQVIDVPGIEGDESKYEESIREAVARAHLVLYTKNAADTKLQTGTAAKIKKYLSEYAKILIVSNSRGLADTFEKEEYRVAIDQTFPSQVAVREQTKTDLAQIVGGDQIVGNCSLHGLMAFFALALTSTGESTIASHRSDNQMTPLNDLKRQQSGFLQIFGDADSMLDFSQLHALQEVVDDHLGRFREEIVESNKRKVLEQVAHLIGTLNSVAEELSDWLSKAEKRVDRCEKSIKAHAEKFSESFRRKLWTAQDRFFNALRDGIHEIIEENFDSKELIEPEFEDLVKRKQKEFESSLTDIKKESCDILFSAVQEELKQLKEDLGRVEFQESAPFENDQMSLDIDDVIGNLKLNWKDLGGAALGIFSGALAGSFLGPWGTVGGAVVGAIMSVIKIFMSRESKIRDAQNEANSKLKKIKVQAKKSLKEYADQTVKHVKGLVLSEALTRIQAELDSGRVAHDRIRQSIRELEEYKMTIQEKSYGTI